jgi:hypothetical protein
MREAIRSNPYLFGHSDQETQRLLNQARLFNPSTRRLLVEVGITAVMSVLDVGSGAGDVALLAADPVGPGMPYNACACIAAVRP